MGSLFNLIGSLACIIGLSGCSSQTLLRVKEFNYGIAQGYDVLLVKRKLGYFRSGNLVNDCVVGLWVGRIDNSYIYVKFNGSMVYAQDNDCNGSVDQLEHDVPFGHPLGNLVSASSLSDIERTLLR